MGSVHLFYVFQKAKTLKKHKKGIRRSHKVKGKVVKNKKEKVKSRLPTLLSPEGPSPPPPTSGELESPNAVEWKEKPSRCHRDKLSSSDSSSSSSDDSSTESSSSSSGSSSSSSNNSTSTEERERRERLKSKLLQQAHRGDGIAKDQERKRPVSQFF